VRTLTLVNDLLTLFLKVNISPLAESNLESGGSPMKKKIQTRWSLWTWMFGGGTADGGVSG
jgi:hypothetical protein